MKLTERFPGFRFHCYSYAHCRSSSENLSDLLGLLIIPIGPATPLFCDWIVPNISLKFDVMNERPKNPEKEKSSKKKSVLAKLNDEKKPDKGTSKK